MATDRRHFIAGLAAFAALSPWQGWGAPGPGPAHFAAFRDSVGYGVAGLDTMGALLFRVRLPGRGHGMAVSPDGRRVVAVARRPQTFAIVIDVSGKQQAYPIAAPPDRHFFGHGIITPDNRHFIATENDFNAGRGVCGVYDLEDNGRRVGEYDTHGVGPHELVVCLDDCALAVANGGIATHPDFPRRRLNLPDMAPSLVYLDLMSGRRLDRVRLPPRWHQVSIRHLCALADGTVWWGGQYQGPVGDDVPLVGYHRPGHALSVIDLPIPVLRGLRQYVGSVTVAMTGKTVALTSPRGSRLLVIDARHHIVRRIFRIRDICAIAASGDGFIAGSGTGALYTFSGPGFQVRTRQQDQGLAWDNHFGRVGPAS